MTDIHHKSDGRHIFMLKRSLASVRTMGLAGLGEKTFCLWNNKGLERLGEKTY